MHNRSLTCINIVKEEIKRYAAPIITDKFRIHNAEQFSRTFLNLQEIPCILVSVQASSICTSTRADSRTNNEGTDTANSVTPSDNINSQFLPYDDMLSKK